MKVKRDRVDAINKNADGLFAIALSLGRVASVLEGCVDERGRIRIIEGKW